MPIALLLHDTWRPLTRGMRRLSVWADVGERLALVGLRMRTAYLVRWFGPRLPSQGNALKVSFTNLHALLARATSARSRQRQRQDDIAAGMGLETAAGLAGSLAGWTAAPTTQLVAWTFYLVTGARAWWKVLLAILGALGGGTLLLTLGAVVSPTAAVVGGDWPLIGNLQEMALSLGALYDSITATAQPFMTFWEQISGPRDKVRNPVLRAFLGAADAAAVLLPQLFGAVAYLMIRVPPALLPAATAILRLAELIKALVAGIVATVDSLYQPLSELFTGPLLRLPARLLSILTTWGEKLGEAFTQGIAALTGVASTARTKLGEGINQIEAVARETILDHPLTMIGPAFTILRDQIGLFFKVFFFGAWNLVMRFMDIVARRVGKATGFEKWFGKGAIPAPTPFPAWVGDLLEGMASLPLGKKPDPFAPLPSFFAPTLRPWDAMVTGAFDRSGMPPNPFELSADAAKGLKERPPSVFAPALADTAARWRQTAQVREAALQVLPAIEAALPAEARRHVASLADVIQGRLPGKATGKEPSEPPPVRILPPPRLRPRVREIYVAAPASVGRDRVDAWLAAVRTALNAEPLSATAVAR